jgi:hypothetical protein
MALALQMQQQQQQQQQQQRLTIASPKGVALSLHMVKDDKYNDEKILVPPTNNDAVKTTAAADVTEQQDSDEAAVVLPQLAVTGTVNERLLVELQKSTVPDRNGVKKWDSARLKAPKRTRSDKRHSWKPAI